MSMFYLNPVAQENSAVTTAPKIKPEDCKIDFRKKRGRVFDFIRGLSPKPGAYTNFRGKKIKILRAEKADGASGKSPGAVRIDPIDKGLAVTCMDGVIKILSLQPEGKKVIAVGVNRKKMIT